MSISAGTFLYIACIEVINEEFSNNILIGKKYFCFVFGFLFGSIIKIFEVGVKYEEKWDFFF